MVLKTGYFDSNHPLFIIEFPKAIPIYISNKHSFTEFSSTPKKHTPSPK
jgi:hypothetical protein